MNHVLTRAGIDPVRVDAVVGGSRTAALFIADADRTAVDDLLLAARHPSDVT